MIPSNTLFILLFCCSHVVLSDKPIVQSSYSAVSGSYSPVKTLKTDKEDLAPTYSNPSPDAEERADLPTYNFDQIKKVIEKVVETKGEKADIVIQEKVDTIAEKSDSASPTYQSAAPVSTGNLYYYYYPVAAYPIYDNPTDSYNNRVGSSDYGSGSDLSPLVFLLVPLVLLLIAIPFLALIGANVNGGRGFRSSELDEKFGSFAELQTEVDHLLEKYVSALDSDDCMNRIVCELGVRASAIPSKELLFKAIEWLAPNHTLLGKERLAVLKTAATQQYTMEMCRMYVCNPPAIVKEGITKETLKKKD